MLALVRLTEVAAARVRQGVAAGSPAAGWSWRASTAAAAEELATTVPEPLHTSCKDESRLRYDIRLLQATGMDSEAWTCKISQ